MWNKSGRNGCLRQIEMKNLKPWLLVALVFCAGVAVGVIGTRIAVARYIKRLVENPNAMRLRIERDLTVQLKLTSDQRQKVHAVITDAQSQIDDLRRDFRPRFVAIMDKAQEEISKTLTPEQRVEFEKLVKEKKQMWQPPLPGPRPR